MRTMRWRAVSRVGEVVVVVVVVGATTAANTVAVGAVGVGAGVEVGSGVGLADGRAEGAGVGDAGSARATGPAAVAFVGWKTMVPPMATSVARPRARMVSGKMLLSARTRRAGARRGDGTVPPGQAKERARLGTGRRDDRRRKSTAGQGGPAGAALCSCGPLSIVRVEQRGTLPAIPKACRARISGRAERRRQVRTGAGGWKGCLNVNASGFGPSAARSARRRNPSATVGRVPVGIHHNTTLGPGQRSNHS